MWFWPQKLDFPDILINSLWSLIAWIVWSTIILIISFVLSDAVNIAWTFKSWELWLETGSIFPLILSVITLIWTTVSMYLTYRLLNITSEKRYKKNIVVSGQIAFFALLTYLFITPIYIYSGLIDYQYIMYVFLIHILIWSFWTSIIIEVLNNYRQVLIWIYWSFVWLFISMSITFLIFTSFSTWSAKLISLVILLPIINFSTTFFKQLFELVYYYYFKYTNQDQLWDIFYQIQMEEDQILKEEEEKNNI